MMTASQTETPVIEGCQSLEVPEVLVVLDELFAGQCWTEQHSTTQTKKQNVFYTQSQTSCLLTITHIT